MRRCDTSSPRTAEWRNVGSLGADILGHAVCDRAYILMCSACRHRVDRGSGDHGLVIGNLDAWYRRLDAGLLRYEHDCGTARPFDESSVDHRMHLGELWAKADPERQKMAGSKDGGENMTKTTSSVGGAGSTASSVSLAYVGGSIRWCSSTHQTAMSQRVLPPPCLCALPGA